MSDETDFVSELRALINRHSKENGSNTPDFILASYLNGCLMTFNATLNKRDRWYGHKTLGAPAARPTIEELEGILSSGDKQEVQVNRDGSCSAVPCDTPYGSRASVKALQIAARVWCDQDMKTVVMDTEAAERIAAIIDGVLSKDR